MNNEIYISSSPLQGYTDYIYRRAHRKFFGGIDNYYTPFLRVEKGEYRSKDLRDLSKDNNDELCIPQLLPDGSQELLRMFDTLREMGWNECDLNFGCPFPMLVKRGKGSGMLKNLRVLEDVAKTILDNKDMRVSVKMRLGYDDAEQGLNALDLLNSLDLVHITCHARLGIDKYTSQLRLDDFQVFYEKCTQPLVYNGNVDNVKTANELIERFPNLKGFALGRPLLQNPNLATEIKNGNEEKITREQLRDFHKELAHAYSENYTGGDHQVLSKLKTIWDYLLDGKFPKEIKKIKKSTSLSKYNEGVNELLRQM